MRNLGYFSCLADPGLCFKEETHPSYGANYYAYFLLYVDYFLVIHHAAYKSLHELDHFLKMKSGSIVDPNMYLGDKLRKVLLEN